MAVKELTTETLREAVLASDTPVVVDFYANWCMPCRQVALEIEALSEKWAGRVRFAKLDVDQAADVAHEYGVSSIPTVLLFEKGKVKASSTGAKPRSVLEEELGLAHRRHADEHGEELQCAC